MATLFSFIPEYLVDGGAIANPDESTTRAGSSVTTEVLENDTSDGVPANLSNVTLPVIVKEPENGTVVVNIDGTITYTPNEGFVGVDTYDYMIDKRESVLPVLDLCYVDAGEAGYHFLFSPELNTGLPLVIELPSGEMYLFRYENGISEYSSWWTCDENPSINGPAFQEAVVYHDGLKYKANINEGFKFFGYWSGPNPDLLFSWMPNIASGTAYIMMDGNRFDFDGIGTFTPDINDFIFDNQPVLVEAFVPAEGGGYESYCANIQIDTFPS